MPPAWISGTPVVFSANSFGKNDRALVAELLDQQMIAGSKIGIVGGVAAAGRSHVLGVERVLKREHDTIHRQFYKIGPSAVGLVEFRRAFQRIGKVPEILANRRSALRKRTERRVPIKIAFAGDRAFAADVECGERVDLPGIAYA